MALLIKGVIVPSVLLAFVAWAYVTFMPKVAEILAK